jgi:hypothetical protein
VESNYIIGSSALSKYCEMKMKKDVIILQVTLDSITVAQANNQRATTLLEQVGLIGNMAYT